MDWTFMEEVSYYLGTCALEAHGGLSNVELGVDMMFESGVTCPQMATSPSFSRLQFGSWLLHQGCC